VRFEIDVFNPSDYARGGPVTAPWQPIQRATGIGANAFQLLDGNGRGISAQIDRIDPADPSLDTLVFSLPSRVAPGPDDYSRASATVFLEAGSGPRPEVSPVPADSPARVELSSGALTVSLSLAPCQDDSGHDWFAGSAQSVRRGATEMLDVWRSLLGFVEHDPEKRCVQIDRLLLSQPPRAGLPDQEIHLHKSPYQLVSVCSGPIREGYTIMSAPFGYVYWDPSEGSRETLVCNFFRSVSLYRGSDCVVEELWLKGTAAGGDAESTNLSFSARYFANMNLGFDPVVYRFETVPDWFAVGYPDGDVHPGYGFATDAHARHLRHPHPGYPDARNAYRTFSWELHPSKRARCLHLFYLDGAVPVEHRAGHAWYEEIYKPLRIKIRGGRTHAGTTGL
jgi:hypothetical protein